ERVLWRKMSNFWVDLETLWRGVGDSLFGFRVYPIAPLVEIMRSSRWMRRFDFDAEAAVRLCWRGVRPSNIAGPVRYLSAAIGVAMMPGATTFTVMPRLASSMASERLAPCRPDLAAA